MNRVRKVVFWTFYLHRSTVCNESISQVYNRQKGEEKVKRWGRGVLQQGGMSNIITSDHRKVSSQVACELFALSTNLITTILIASTETGQSTIWNPSITLSVIPCLSFVVSHAILQETLYTCTQIAAWLHTLLAFSRVTEHKRTLTVPLLRGAPKPKHCLISLEVTHSQHPTTCVSDWIGREAFRCRLVKWQKETGHSWNCLANAELIMTNEVLPNYNRPAK